MDNAFQELDYSDISAKYIQNNKENKSFGEIYTKKGNYGLIKLVVFFILFLLLIILVIVVLVKNSNLKSTEQKIKDDNEQLISNQRNLDEKNKKLNKLLKDNLELENKIMNAMKEEERIENNMIKYVNENTKIKIDITSLEKEVEDLQQDFKNYDGFEKSELLIEYEILLEKIEKLKQSPM